jgi:hypothetical protein
MYEIELFLQTTKDLLDNERRNKWARKVQNPRKHRLNEVSIIVSNTNDEAGIEREGSLSRHRDGSRCSQGIVALRDLGAQANSWCSWISA